MKEKNCKTNHKINSFEDIYLGKSADELVWTLSSQINNQSSPTEESFYVQNGKKFLISGAYKRMSSHEKDRGKTWYITDYGDTEYKVSEEEDVDVFNWKTPIGNLTGRRLHNHFHEYPVKTVEEIDAWIHIYRNITFSPNQAWFKQVDVNQIKLISLSWSPVQQLIQFDTGLENFYFFLIDAPEKMKELLDVMQERCLDRLRLCLSLFESCPCIQWGENTSSSAISPDYYRQLTLPHIREYADLIHENDKRLVVHMCGLLKDLLDCFVETDIDGIHSVTPPPFGDAPYSLVRETFQPDFTIIGRFNAQLWVGKSIKEIQENIKKQISRELVNSPFALLVTDDAMPDIPYDDVMTLYEALSTIKV